MLIIARTFRRSFPYVCATAHWDEAAVSSHPPELAIVEALITEGPGQHDVIHALAQRGELPRGNLVPPHLWKTFPSSPHLDRALEGALRVALLHFAVVGTNAKCR